MTEETKNKKKSSLSLSNHSKSSHHGKGEFLSITVRKDHPKEKAGIRLEQEANGRLRVSNIAANGLFAQSELEIGDVVLSINARRLSDGQGPEDLLKVANEAKTTITMVVKKLSKQPTPANPKAQKKTQKKETSNDTSNDNNVTLHDNYYKGDLSKHNEDGSLNAKFTEEDVQKALAGKYKKSDTLATTISATKRNPTDAHGLTLVVENKRLMVGRIEPRSMFDSDDVELQVGDRVLSINDMNFRVYADADYAYKVLEKSGETITVIVEHCATSNNNKNNNKKKTGSSCNNQTKKKAAGTTTKERPSISKTHKVRADTTTKVTSQKASYSDDDSCPTTDDSSHSSSNVNKKKTAGNTTASETTTHNKPRGGDRIENDFKIESFREVTIAAPKRFTKQLVGLEFKVDDRVQLVYVDKIAESSMFYRTSLQEGDWILSINDVNLRNPSPTFDARRVAAKTCLQAKESVSLVVLKDETTYLQKEFNLDQSCTNLQWVK